MKILHIYKSALPHSMGGIEQVVHQLSSSTAKSGAVVNVLALHKGNAEVVEGDGYSVHYVPQLFEIASTPFSIKAINKFKELTNQADLVHYHYPYPFADLLHVTSTPNKPSVVTYHSDIIRQKNLLKLYAPLQKKFLSSVDHIVATSPHYLQSSTTLQKYSDKVSIIPLGLDEANYPKPPSELLAKWREHLGPKFFFFSGVLRYYKGLHTLVDALKGVDYPTVILGTGPEEASLKEQARSNGLKNIHFVGALPDEDKSALLTLCYAMVFPSHLRSEAFGLSLVEASMFGKPMITCDIGTGTSYVNQNDKTGFVIPPEAPQDLQESMSILWSDNNKAKEMRENSRNRYTDIFTGDKMVEKYIDLYKEIL